MSRKAELPLNAGQESLFENGSARDPRELFGHGVPKPYKVDADPARIEEDIDRLDDQGQTNPTTALGRLGVGREEADGEIYPKVFPGRPNRSQLRQPRRWERDPRTLTAREKRTADQPPTHERHDPYA